MEFDLGYIVLIFLVEDIVIDSYLGCTSWGECLWLVFRYCRAIFDLREELQPFEHVLVDFKVMHVIFTTWSVCTSWGGFLCNFLIYTCYCLGMEHINWRNFIGMFWVEFLYLHMVFCMGWRGLCEISLYTHVIFYPKMEHMSWRSSLGRFFVDFLVIHVIFT